MEFKDVSSRMIRKETAKEFEDALAECKDLMEDAHSVSDFIDRLNGYTVIDSFELKECDPIFRPYDNICKPHAGPFFMVK